jgi:hypothetical protein
MLSAYSNKPSIKTKYVRQFNQHIKQENLIRGDYKVPVNSHFKGCAITCMLNDPKTPYSQVKINHSAFVTEPIQFPEWLGILIDSFHEKTSSIEFSQDFQVRLLKAIPVGFSDWKTIQLKFLIFVLEDCKIHNPELVQTVIDLLNREIAGDAPTGAEWSAARSAAESVAESAAESAAWDKFANHLVELFESY